MCVTVVYCWCAWLLACSLCLFEGMFACSIAYSLACLFVCVLCLRDNVLVCLFDRLFVFALLACWIVSACLLANLLACVPVCLFVCVLARLLCLIVWLCG